MDETGDICSEEASIQRRMGGGTGQGSNGGGLGKVWEDDQSTGVTTGCHGLRIGGFALKDN